MYFISATNIDYDEFIFLLNVCSYKTILKWYLKLIDELLIWYKAEIFLVGFFQPIYI